ncbi:Synaptonemal complex protein 1 [Camellia lanceoleosa]|uniref:Synaptonemal complex protein 1 n=1 Tax=Camellia lanceoleosa TaxID=1840588 RepID=A0ACC0HYJ2_9ERIC|nr:Synaptonemal complex protein 1 [Camellia lanceoleosa]
MIDTRESTYTFAVNTSRCPNSTVNRRLTTFLDLKSPSSATKPIHGVTTCDTTIDSSLNLWFRLYTPPPSHPPHHHRLRTILRFQSISVQMSFNFSRNEHEVQLKALKGQHEDECKKLKEELDVQKSKEDRQRVLLQLQWKVMGDKPQEDQEVD